MNMKFGIKHQSTYSRGQLLLRSFFGMFYIMLPHGFLIYFLSIAAMFVNFLNFWIILFIGSMPESFFNFLLNFQRWVYRVNARMMNLSDGYPAFGLQAIDPHVIIEVERPEKSNRVSVLLRTFFGFIYVLIPHAFCLIFIQLGAMFVMGLNFWIILITGKQPTSFHRFLVGMMRWNFRLALFMLCMTDKYPPFSLSGDEAEFE
jgi:hypothetical protein